jgi:hypothetical protein
MEIRELTKEIRDKSIEYAKPKELDSLSASWYQEDLLSGRLCLEQHRSLSEVP